MGNYKARATLENGLAASRKCEDYTELYRWLAANAQAGIEAWDIDEGRPVDQAQLRKDVEYYGG